MQSTIRNIFITTLLFCLNIFMNPGSFAMDVPDVLIIDGVSFSRAEKEGFLRTTPIQPDIILNAGELGYYRFTDDQNLLTEADLIKIRPELLDLIRALRQEPGNSFQINSFQIIDGLRTPQHNIYRWAAWLNEHPRQLKMLNARGYQSWAEWIAASQTIPGSVSLQSKHQTGDAAEITWDGLETTTERHRDLIAHLITELGGKSKGDSLFKTIAVENEGKPAFRIVYQPSEVPPLPAPHQIGTQFFDSEHIVYIKGSAEGETSTYAYLAQLIDPLAEPAETVTVYIFNEEIHKKLGDTIPATFILAERTMPADGWGTSQVMLSFYRNDAWIHTLEATVFEDYYLLPERLKNEPLQGPRRVGLGEIRVTIPVTYEHD